MAGVNEGTGGQLDGLAEASDLLSYITDVSVSVGSLLQACCSGTEGGSVGWGGPGGVGPLALRFQGKDGEVSPEGLAAALALTFEATLPSLEGLLLMPGKVWLCVERRRHARLCVFVCLSGVRSSRCSSARVLCASRLSIVMTVMVMMISMNWQ